MSLEVEPQNATTLNGEGEAAPAEPAASPSVAPPRPPDSALLRPIWGVYRTVRPHQWVKNVFVLAAVVFAKDLFVPGLLMRAGGAFFVFCLVAGAVYTINDIVDAEADRIHPVKRYRPIASGVLPIEWAKWLVGVLLVLALGGAFYGPPLFGAVVTAYLLLNLAYSFKLKHIAYVDVGCIALGFVLRVIAGGLATRIQVSAYMLLCTAFLALFLGFGKRAHELAVAERGARKKQRVVLQQYKPATLGRAFALSGIASIGTYIAYTIDPNTREMFQSDWLWLTTPMPAFGMLRFVYLARNRPRAESPTQEILRDVPFMLNLVLWVAVVTIIVYQVQPGVR